MTPLSSSPQLVAKDGNGIKDGSCRIGRGNTFESFCKSYPVFCDTSDSSSLAMKGNEAQTTPDRSHRPKHPADFEA
jgi:hypothetical protein